MKTLLRTLFLTPLLGISSLVYGDTVEAGRDIEDNDIQALKDWINTRRQVSLKEVGGDLSISGEVRTEFQSAWEDRDGVSQRGSGPLKLPGQGFDIEFNLMLDYRTDRTWASVKVEFDNDAGVFSGSLNSIALERAYWGVRVLDCDNYIFDVEVGRRTMTSVFDSKVQFGSFFDGILFRYDHTFEKLGDFYLHAGPFVINDRRNHYGYGAELGLLNIKGTGFYSKFSFVAWHTKTYEDDFVTDRFRFLNSQLTAGYRFKVESIKKMGIVYSAFLYNLAAKKLVISNNEKANWAFYAGASMGHLRQQWDWAFDVNYQIVGAQAVADFDVSGFSVGNADRSGFYTRFIKPLDGGGPSTPPNAGGRANYHGFMGVFDILLTDKLDMQNSFIQSWTFNDDIGPKRSFIQYELEFIYSW